MVICGGAAGTPSARMEQLRVRVQLKAVARNAAAEGDLACSVGAASAGGLQRRPECGEEV